MTLKSLLLIEAYSAASVAYCDEASKAAKVEEFFRLAKMDEMLRQGLTMAMEQTKTGYLQEVMGVKLTSEQEKELQIFQEKVVGLLSDAFSWEKLKPGYTKLYSDAFSEAELDGMVAFYKSPAGQAMVAKTPVLMTKSTAFVQESMAEVQPALQKLMREYMSKAVQRVKESPQPSPKLN